MPKERIVDGALWVHYPEGYAEPGDGPTPNARLYRGEPIPEGAVVAQEPSVDLIWRRESQPGAADGIAQLVVECDPEWTRRALADATEGRYVQIPLEALDRRGLNQLIRHLKRARDHAYGADE